MSSFVFFIVISTIVCAYANVSQHNPFYSYSQDPIRPQLGMFGKVSSYEISRGQQVDASVSDCTASRFWLLQRHGTRLPKSRELDKILEHNEGLHEDIVKNYDAGRTSLSSSDFSLIRNWQFDTNITSENDQYLTVSGWDEVIGIAKRYQEAYPTLLPTDYSPRDYFFRSTSAQRTLASLRAFADGLFGYNGFEQVLFDEIPDLDVLLRPQDFCQLYINNFQNSIEQEEFVEGPEYQEMIKQVSAKFGFHGSHQLKAVEVETLAYICKYEQIWYINSTSPLCAGFSVANHQVIEYNEDLLFYYSVGYGYTAYRRLIENLNCHLIQDMLEILQSNDASDAKARILGTHSTTLLLILVTFGAFEDETPLTRHNFAQQTLRQWKTSLIAPMATNLAVVRYE